ncbi:MAG: adenosine-specific kinase [Candidatus Omnitrophota bacterium]
MEIKTIKVDSPAEANVIVGQSHFIKSVEDIYETLICSCPGIKFGVAFCEASGACLVRTEGNDEHLKQLAGENALNIGAGHSFIIIMQNAFPINVLNALKTVPEVCAIFCATANPVEIIVAETKQGKAILGVIDGLKPQGIEDEEGKKWRKEFLRRIGYKR